MLIGENWREYLDESADPDLNYIPSEWFIADSKDMRVFAYPDSPTEMEREDFVPMIIFSVPQEEINSW